MNEKIELTAKQIAYQEFLKSDFWLKLTEKKKGIVKKCEVCTSFDQLHSHHKFYRNDLYKTELDDLVVLCYRCHGLLHSRMPIWEPKIKEINIKDATDNIFYTITNEHTKGTNSVSKRYTSLDDAILKAKERIISGISGVFIMKSVKYVTVKNNNF